MPTDFHKASCLERAKALLAQEDDTLLRYVCLELRFCLEDITYNKLQTYSTRLPDEILETWQPPQALKALLEFEPDADQNFTLNICAKTESGVPTGEWDSLGSHHIFKLDWLRKTYNKLGNFLHVPTLKAQRGTNQQRTLTQLRKSLEEIITELEPIVASSMDASLAKTIEFSCSVCNQTIIRNRDSALKTKKAVCLNPNCGAMFVIGEDKEGNLSSDLIVRVFPCGSCKHKNQIAERKLVIGYRFNCQQCGEEHEVHQWAYGWVKDLSEANT